MRNLGTALVTGASGGIGRAICNKLYSDGWHIVVHCYKNYEAGKRLASEVDGIVCRADVADYADAQSMVEGIGTVDLLVNNAGIAQYGLFQMTTYQERERLIAVNLHGAMNCAAAVLPEMIRRQSGCIINISSVWGNVGASCEVVYSASKAALIGFTKALAKEAAPSGIRVNCVAPGLIDTQINSRFTSEELAVLGKQGQPQDVANIVSFLASDKAGFINGSVFEVNGGFLS